MSRVLVTGGYGLLGTWLCRALLERGDEVVVLDSEPRERSGLALDGLAREVTVVAADIRDGDAVAEALADGPGTDAIVHLAAQTLVGVARLEPADTHDVNVRGTWTVLEACRRTCPEAPVVVASSDKAYGEHEDLPYVEDLPLRGANPYDASKAAADILARSYFHAYGLPVAVTRCANLFGGGDLHPSRLVPESLTAALAGRAPVVRSDGSPVRDFLHASDAAGACLALLRALRDGRGLGEAFNVGADHPRSVLEVVAAACAAAGAPQLEPDVRGTGIPAGEIARQYLDSTRVRELTGWRPQLDLAAGLREAAGWYERHGDAVAGPVAS